jgi:two-component system, cell cycle response regulator
MEPPLRERLRWRNATRDGAEPPARRAPLAPIAALLFGAASLICLTGVFVPGDAQLDDTVLLVTAAASALVSAFLLVVNERVPVWTYHPIGVVATAISTGAAYGWGSGSAFGPLLYVWVTMFAFYVFTRGAALVHLALMAVAYAIALTLEDPAENPLDGWIATVGSLLGTGLFVSFVRDRLSGMFHRLREAAHRDALTELLNRRGFQGVFDLELERARRADQPLSLIVGDLDRFKRVNDVHGHATGDDVLVRVADAIRGAKRGFDSAARVGGEEFAVLAPDCDAHGAYVLAERIRSAVHEALSGNVRGGPLTISFGISTFPLHGQSADGLLSTADQALYAAKRLGRNRVQIGRPPGGTAVVQEHDEDAVLAYLQRLADEIDTRLASEEHSAAIARWAGTIADHLGLGPDARWRAELAGRVHDIGKIIVTDEILLKPGPLTGGEWAVLRRHPVQGARLVGLAEGLYQVAAVVRQHHERFDGTGYPDGRTGEEIRIEARVVAVCDAWAAIRSNRPYDAARPVGAAREQLRVASGSQFDPTVVAAFLELEQAGVIGTFEAAPVRSSTSRVRDGRSP